MQPPPVLPQIPSLSPISLSNSQPQTSEIVVLPDGNPPAYRPSTNTDTALSPSSTDTGGNKESAKDGIHGGGKRLSLTDRVEAEERDMIAANSLDEAARMQIVFRDLTYTIKVTAKAAAAGKGKSVIQEGQVDGGESKGRRGGSQKVDKRILNGVTGSFEPGRLTAVMGASGAGKTSLLQVVAAEARNGSLTGSIQINGKDAHAGSIKTISGFVFQDDIILDTMTVREAITMSATLRLPTSMSTAEKDEKVTGLIKLLNLEKAAGTIIGNSMKKGISGGERKRTAMAMEMITNPSVLFLDEPTSGLDTFTAYSVVRILRNLAATGRTVVATIHQPSSEVFQLFDDLILMADGRIIYAGPALEAVDYFGAKGYNCPDFTNPADFLFMSVLNNEDPTAGSGDAKNVPVQSQAERITGLLEAWAVSPECNRQKAALDASSHKGGITSSALKSSADFATQIRYLFGRASRNAIRNPLVVKAKLGQTVIISLIIGILFQGTGGNFDYAGAQNRAGMLFFSTVNMVMSSTIGVLSIFGEEKIVFSREYGAGYYGLSSYFVSKILVEMPFQVIFPWMFGTIVYWFVGLQNSAEKYFIFSLFAVLSACCGFSLGIAIASIFESLETALAMAPLILMPLMLFSGLFVNNGAIPVYFDWIKYISPMKYAFEGLYKNEFTGLSIACTTSTALVDGSVCISNQGMDDNFSIFVCAIILLSIAIILIFVAFLSLLRLVLSKGKAIEPIRPTGLGAA